ncbi:unnamed protein product, partial [Allacma fusca]
MNTFRNHIAQSICLTLMEQDIIFPEATPSRILLSSWLLSALVFTTAYRSKLFIQMTFPLLQESPQNLKELANSDFQWGLESSGIGGAAHYYFSTSKNPVSKKIFAKMSLEYNSQKCFTRTLKSDFACITYSDEGEYVLNRNFSRNSNSGVLMVMSEDLTGNTGTGIVYKTRAVFGVNFDKVVRNVWEMGLIEKWRRTDYEQEREKHLNWLRAGNTLDG